MRKRLNVPTVSVTLELPVEVAEYLANHGEDLIREIRFALDDFKRNPPPDQAEERRQERERRSIEIQKAMAELGRRGYRMLRTRESAIEYRTREGHPRKPGNAEKQSNRRTIIAEIAQELGKDREHVAHAIELFRHRFRIKLRDRRRREVWRLFQQGLTNKAISEGLKISLTSVVNDLKYLRDQQRRDGQK